MVRRGLREIVLTKLELENGFAYKSSIRLQRYYRLGEVRKVIDNIGHNQGMKVTIKSIRIDENRNRDGDRGKLFFEIVNEDTRYIQV